MRTVVVFLFQERRKRRFLSVLLSVLAVTTVAGSQSLGLETSLEPIRIALDHHDLTSLRDKILQIAASHSLIAPELALDLLGRALTAAQLSHDERLQAVTLYALGQFDYDAGRNDEALKNLQAALKLSGGNLRPGEEARIRVSLCAVYSFTGHPDQALETLGPAISTAEDATLHASALTRRAEVFSVTGKMKDALADTTDALTLERKDRLALLTIDTLIVQGEVLNNLGETVKALVPLAEALATARNLHDRRDEGRALNFQGEVAFNSGKNSEAFELWNEALPIEREAGDRPDEATTLHDIGAYCWAIGDAHKAIEFYEQARVIQRQVLDRGDEAVTLNDLGNAYADSGEPQKAIQSFDQALILERAVGDPANEAITLHSEAALYQNIAQTAKAIELYEKALLLERRADDTRAAGKTLGNLACLYQDLNKKQRALQLDKEALQLQRKAEDHRSEAVTLHNIGTIYLAAGQQSTSRSYLEQSLALERKGGDLHAEAYTRWRLASLGTQSLDGYLGALRLAQAAGDLDLAGRIQSSLMRYYRNHGSVSTAIFFGKQAVNNFQHLRLKLKDLGQTVQDGFAQSRGDTYRDLARLLFHEDRFTEAEQVIGLLKKQEHAEFARGEGGPASTSSADPLPLTPAEEGAASATADEMQWLDLKSMQTSRTPEQQVQYTALNAKLGAVNRSFSDSMQAILAKGVVQKNVMAETSGLQNILRQLRDQNQHTIGVYTLVSETELDLIFVTKDLRLPPRKIAISRDDLTAKIRQMRYGLQDPCSDPRAAAEVMYKLLISPILADLKGAKATTIVWELDGALRYIPMSALYDGTHYLAETYRSVLFSTGNQSGLTAEGISDNWTGLGFGTSEQRGSLQPLPSVATELHGIFRDERDAKSSGPIPGHIYLNKDFNKETLANELDKGYPIVHIASHFVLKPGSDQSYLLLGSEQPGEPESGRLTYAEMRDGPSFHFDNVQLLTLSACQTGTSAAAHPQDGAEVDALGDLATSRGARAVMATLWSVNDASTGQFMIEFYKDWSTVKGTSKAEALREAQMNMLHGSDTADVSCKSSLKHPYFWAPFVLIGNWQ